MQYEIPDDSRSNCDSGNRCRTDLGPSYGRANLAIGKRVRFGILGAVEHIRADLGPVEHFLAVVVIAGIATGGVKGVRRQSHKTLGGNAAGNVFNIRVNILLMKL